MANWSRKEYYEEWRIWYLMKYRCSQNKPGYADVTVCDAWQDWQQFMTDMGPRPSKEYSIDRIDPYGDYEPGNCRWATQKEQCGNKRWNHSELGYWRAVAEQNGIKGNTWQWRMRVKGMSPEEAATKLVKK